MIVSDRRWPQLGWPARPLCWVNRLAVPSGLCARLCHAFF